MNFRRSFVALAILLTAMQAKALDLVLADGTHYSNIQLKEKSDLGIRVGHSYGLTFVDYLSLTPGDQLTFGYDEARYKAQRTAFSGATTPAPVAQATPYNRRFTDKYASAPMATATPYSSPSVPYSPPPTQYIPPPIRAGAASGQCAAITKKGYQCSRRASAGSSYCWQHGRR